jgi:hypothetical protein
VCFVQVNCSVAYAPPISLPNYGTSTHCVIYVELPQMTVAMMNGAGAAYNMMTWHGTAFLRTLSPDQVCMMILKLCLHNGPITLRAAAFNLTDVEVDDTSPIEQTYAKILKLGFKQICVT